MKHSLPLKNSLVAGTLLLTLAGSLSRVIGFFYRIFLSRTIGAEGIGIYQLIFPLLALCISLTSSGIQTAVSKFTAEKYGSGRTGEAFLCLYAGFFLSIASSLSACTFLCRYADALAAGYLDEPRCAPLIRIMAYSLPFSAVHACANGYYYGMKKAAVPAVSQLLEQVVRVASVYVIALIYTEKGAALSADIAVLGIVCGEIFSALFCITVLPFQKKQGHFIGMLKNIALFSLPLTANRVALNFFQSLEALMIPSRLRLFGYTQSEALSVFGILTGMALPMILFPNVVTNSVSVMLLPAISEARAKRDHLRIQKAIKKTIESCMILGLMSTLFSVVRSLHRRICFREHACGNFYLHTQLDLSFFVSVHHSDQYPARARQAYHYFFAQSAQQRHPHSRHLRVYSDVRHPLLSDGNAAFPAVSCRQCHVFARPFLQKKPPCYGSVTINMTAFHLSGLYSG